MSRIITLLKGKAVFKDNHGCSVDAFFAVFYIFFAEGPEDGLPPTRETLLTCQSLAEYLASKTP